MGLRPTLAIINAKTLNNRPPMARNIAWFEDDLRARGYDLHCPPVEQQLTGNELIDLVPHYDAWIIGEDPVTDRILSAAIAGKLIKAVC